MNNSLFSDPSLGTVSQQYIVDDFPVIIINHPNCQAKISLYGGHVLSWQPNNERDVFWLSRTSAYQKGKAIRGGIPLCWPWFGPKEGSTQHGFARQILWEFVSVDVNEQGVTVVISWQGNNIDKLWPHKAKLEQTLFFGQDFSQELTITNLTDSSIDYTGALHSYFSVSAPQNVTVPKLDYVAFDDKLTNQEGIPAQRSNCVGPIDTVYHTHLAQQVIDTGWQRIIEITNQNTHQWVLWNPGVEKAQAMADIHENGEQEYVCLEAANTKVQRISAHQTAKMKQHIQIKKCA